MRKTLEESSTLVSFHWLKAMQRHARHVLDGHPNARQLLINMVGACEAALRELKEETLSQEEVGTSRA